MNKDGLAPNGISYSEYERRWNALIERLPEVGADVFVATNTVHVEYLTGYDYTERGGDMAPFFVIVGKDVPRTIVARGMEKASVEAEAIPLEFAPYFSGTEDALPAWAKTLERLGLSSASLALELDTWGLCYKDVTTLQELLPSVKVIDGTQLLDEIIDIRSPEEIGLIKQAISYTDLLFDAWFHSLRVGISEYESQEKAVSLVSAATPDTVEIRSALTNTLFGKRTGLPHGYASKHSFLKEGDIATMEIGTYVSSYAGGYCRTAIFQGRHKEAEKLHALSNDAVQAGLDAIRPGVSAGAVDHAMRSVVDRAGRSSCYRHRGGYSHGIGWNLRRGLSICPGATRTIEKDMVLFITCFLYDESGEFGITSTDTALVTDDGCEIFTDSPRDIRYL